MQWFFKNQFYHWLGFVLDQILCRADWKLSDIKLPGLQLHLQGNVTWQLSGAERGHQSFRVENVGKVGANG